jgi:uncharacterized protein YdbL (DUF1318 family)
VTINVYFPAAAAEKAADKMIDDITGETPANPPPRSQLAPAHEESGPNAFTAAIGSILYVLVPAANAQASAESLRVKSPAIDSIKASMRERFKQLGKFFDSGAVGLTANGLVELRDLNAVALGDRATVKRLVAEDNADRAQLYAEIARANNHPEWEADIRKMWASRWVKRAQEKGWYYKSDDGAWKQQAQ